jgi:hypothetical protein
MGWAENHSQLDLIGMSTTDLTVAPGAAQQPLAVKGQLGAGIPWARVALACAVLILAGAAHWLQQRRVDELLRSGLDAPFPLKNLPTTLGAWRVPEGGEEVLDPEIVQALRCVDYSKRRYVNEQTGVGIESLILYGPATIAHKPELCYPGSGYTLADTPRIRTFSVPGSVATFISLIFAKGEGAAIDRQQVFYSIRVDGKWTVNMDYKRMGRVPGLYKIQLERRMGPGERRDIAGDRDPCESFLEALMPELERRISSAR